MPSSKHRHVDAASTRHDRPFLLKIAHEPRQHRRVVVMKFPVTEVGRIFSWSDRPIWRLICYSAGSQSALDPICTSEKHGPTVEAAGQRTAAHRGPAESWAREAHVTTSQLVSSDGGNLPKEYTCD